MITQKVLKELFLHDEEKGVLYWKNPTSFRVKKGEFAGTVYHDGNVNIQIKGKVYKRHRLIWMFKHGYFPKQLDHIDRDRSNDRLNNLRESNQSENNANKAKTNKKTSSIYIGVSWSESRKRWESKVMKNRKTYHLGRFKCEIEAAKARDKKAVELFGEFAERNFNE